MGTDGPFVFGRRAERAEDDVELLKVGLAGHVGHAQHELGEDAADGPRVGAERVGPRAEQELGRAVPSAGTGRA